MLADLRSRNTAAAVSTPIATRVEHPVLTAQPEHGDSAAIAPLTHPGQRDVAGAEDGAGREHESWTSLSAGR